MSRPDGAAPPPPARERAAVATRQRMPVRRALLPERLLAKLWQAKAGRKLRTTDGRTLRVVYPGRPAPGHGPDFRDALLVLGGRQVRGPVELHRTPAEWLAHGHQRDRAYRDVVLHVVQAAQPAAPQLGLPTVVLRADGAGARRAALALPDGARPDGDAHSPLSALARLGTDDLRAALRRAGLVRFGERVHEASAAVREQGVEQALYASILEALGYAENRAPFAELARRLPLRVLRSVCGAQPEGVRHEAAHGLLASCAGLAPEAWCRTAGAEPMDPACWRTSGVRPASHPSRRLEAAAALVVWSIPRGLRSPLSEACGAGARALVDALRLRASPAGAPLVGTGRAREIAVGAVLPALAAEAAVLGDRALEGRVHDRYERFPALPDNTVTREAQRLLGPGGETLRLSACEHQGLMYLYRHAVEVGTLSREKGFPHPPKELREAH